jgi:hypothetical protein
VYGACMCAREGRDGAACAATTTDFSLSLSHTHSLFPFQPPPPQPSTHSDFLSAQFAALKQANPGFPLLVREADGVTPVAYARYEQGVEASVPLAGLDAAGVEAAVGGLVAKGPRG